VQAGSLGDVNDLRNLPKLKLLISTNENHGIATRVKDLRQSIWQPGKVAAFPIEKHRSVLSNRYDDVFLSQRRLLLSRRWLGQERA
jgi:hypothetical protein